MAGFVHVPWYATVFRGDKFEIALREIAPVALRYGATEYSVFRSTDDRYRFLQIAAFDSKLAWERYWEGEEFIGWRSDYTSWFQVPIVYAWHDLVIGGQLGTEETTEPVRAPADGSEL